MFDHVQPLLFVERVPVSSRTPPFLSVDSSRNVTYSSFRPYLGGSAIGEAAIVSSDGARLLKHVKAH